MILITLTIMITTCYGCQTWDSCQYQNHICFKGNCKTYDKIMEDEYKLGEACINHSECSPGVCMTGLSTPTCGPGLSRSTRHPSQEPSKVECKSDVDCEGEEEKCWPTGETGL